MFNYLTSGEKKIEKRMYVAIACLLKSNGALRTAGVILILASCTSKQNKEAQNDASSIPFSIVKIFPHDPSAFTQGLTIASGRLFESTGQQGSWIAEVDIATGKQDKKVVLDKKYFGEGIAVLNNRLFQLTWQNHEGFVYDLRTFARTDTFKYDYEGWGITHNGKNLIVSDGTATLRFLDTLSLATVSTLKVTDKLGAADKLNELEFVEGFLFANQWQTNYILKIDPVSGAVVGRLDLTALAEKMYPLNPRADVLNGIAYERKSGLLLVTGKLWPSLFALRLQNSTAANP